MYVALVEFVALHWNRWKVGAAGKADDATLLSLLIVPQ